MTLHEYEPVRFERLETKDETLLRLRPPLLQQEVVAMYDAGYDIEFGSSEDQAYDRPDKIWEVYERIEKGGHAFRRAARRHTLGVAGVAQALEHSPLTITKNARRRVRAYLKEDRARILYDQPDIQAMSWHLQNGKALALGTITDAHELYTDESEGTYLTIAGSLPADFTEQRFTSGSSENLAGKTTREAIIAVQQQLFGKDEGAAVSRADKELLDVESFLYAPVQQGFKEVVQYCTDSLGIRSRMADVSGEINKYIEQSPKESFLMMSVGCGTAQLMLDVLRAVHRDGRSANLVLIDQDPIALAAAQAQARQLGLEDMLETHCVKLFTKEGHRTKMMQLDSILQGRKVDVAEDTGLREYFPDSMYKDLTKQIWNALDEDGIMTTGNMNRNRPQADFLHGLMGWPIKVQMRHISDIVRLHHQAGVPRETMRLRVTQEGDYTLCFSSKRRAA